MSTTTKESLVTEAENLFFTLGFRAVSLQQICDKLKIKPSSLYYHFPKGKEELYLAAASRKVGRFESAVNSITADCRSLEEALVEFGFWYVSLPPANMMLLAEMDLPYLSERSRRKVNEMVTQSVFGTLSKLFKRFSMQLRADFHPSYLVGTFGVLLFSIHTAVKKSKMEPRKVIRNTVRLFLTGAGRSGS